MAAWWRHAWASGRRSGSDLQGATNTLIVWGVKGDTLARLHALNSDAHGGAVLLTRRWRSFGSPAFSLLRLHGRRHHGQRLGPAGGRATQEGVPGSRGQGAGRGRVGVVHGHAADDVGALVGPAAGSRITG